MLEKPNKFIYLHKFYVTIITQIKIIMYNNNSNYRHLSLALRLKILFGNTTAQSGWGILILGQIFFILFVMQVDFSDFYLGKNSPKTQGKITKINNTNTRINKRNVYEFHYEYQDKNNVKLQGISYSTNKDLSINSLVNVEYLEKKTTYSRIENMQKKLFPMYIILLAVISLIGIVISVISISRGLKNIRLLQIGVVTKGKFIKMEPTKVKVDNQFVQRLYFEFTDHFGKTQTTTADLLDTKKLQDEPEETIFYDAENPSKALLIDGLPSNIKLLPDNTFEKGNILLGVVYLILPFFGLLSILMAFV
ncbi:MAG: hypothetical protein EAZ85_01245 [Bacteroidetes bacterium]|nr:MAG: hypothetical protein EAZ85_01245 [Bacteroidota bacterium]TAG90425.1 MAG: hypothetical protein EAZ20_04335 [Bacteroidota bacterium]